MTDTDSFDIEKLDTRYVNIISGLALSLNEVYTRTEHIAKADKTGYILDEGLPALQIANDAIRRSLIAHKRAKELKEKNFEPLFLRFDDNGNPIRVTEQEYNNITPSVNDNDDDDDINDE